MKFEEALKAMREGKKAKLNNVIHTLFNGLMCIEEIGEEDTKWAIMELVYWDYILSDEWEIIEE